MTGLFNSLSLPSLVFPQRWKGAFMGLIAGGVGAVLLQSLPIAGLVRGIPSFCLVGPPPLTSDLGQRASGGHRNKGKFQEERGQEKARKKMEEMGSTECLPGPGTTLNTEQAPPCSTPMGTFINVPVYKDRKWGS